MKVLFEFNMTRTQVSNFLKLTPKQAIENSLLSHDLSPCSDGPSNSQQQSRCNAAAFANTDGR
jgi:hypothetical protein